MTYIRARYLSHADQEVFGSNHARLSSHAFGELICFIPHSDWKKSLLEMFEGKWTLQLLRELFNGVKRFGELRRSLHPISPKTLTDRLRMLEERRIVTRTVYSEVPLHVEYELTERGQRLQPIFVAMWAWTQSEDADSQKEASEPLLLKQ